MEQQCKEMFSQLDRQIYAGLSEEELLQLSLFLKRLINNLTSDEVRNVSNHTLMCMMKELEHNDLESTKKED